MNNEGGTHRSALNISGEYRGGVIAALRGVEEDSGLNGGPLLASSAGPASASHDPLVISDFSGHHSRREGPASGVREVIQADSSTANKNAILNSNVKSTAADQHVVDSAGTRKLKVTNKKLSGQHSKLGKSDDHLSH
jgi:hypothetical protein